MRCGLALLTCVPADAVPGVRQRLPTAITTLLDSGYPGPVFVVDDGSTDVAHQAYLNSLPAHIHVIRRPNRGGIARAKNTCLRVLSEANVELGFLAEDDVAFFPGWCDAYGAAHTGTGIHHFSWAWDDDPTGNMHKERREIHSFPVAETSRVNGVFLTFTSTALRKIGGFKVLPSIWGHEHTNWTRRMIAAGLTPFFADLVDSRQYIGLNQHAGDSTIAVADRARFALENVTAAEELDPVYLPLCE